MPRRPRYSELVVVLPGLPGIRRRVKILDLGVVEERGGLVLLWMDRDDFRLLRRIEKMLREELAPLKPSLHKLGEGGKGRGPRRGKTRVG